MNKVSTAFLPVSFLFAGPGPVVRSKRVTLAGGLYRYGPVSLWFAPENAFFRGREGRSEKNGTDRAVPFREAVRCLTG